MIFVRKLLVVGLLAALFYTFIQMNTTKPSTIVIGTGLAGLSTALRLLKHGHTVTLIEKTDKFGGNSIKASSGINGVPTAYQTPGDSVNLFKRDMMRSGRGLSDEDLVNVLTAQSKSAIEWLTGDDFKIDLSSVTQLGGHSHPRTHRGSGSLPPGFAIILGLLKSLETYSPYQLKVMKNCRFDKLLVDLMNRVSGIEYIQDQKRVRLESANVVLATGGYSADSELINEYRPDLVGIPLTNGKQTTGDGVKIASRDVGAKLVHMDQVQLHPTGFVKLDSRHDSWKFLCGELIRGIGGILLSPDTGNRFVNELQARDEVTRALNENCAEKIAIIIVNSKDYLNAKNHIDFYVSQGLMFKGTTEDLAELVRKNLPCNLHRTHIDRTLLEYDSLISLGRDNLFQRSKFGNYFTDGLATFYYGLVTPVVHYSMGGLAITPDGEVLNENDQVIENLYAVGEVGGGLHGGNRLGGSSLLDCVVFGKVVSDKIITKY